MKILIGIVTIDRDANLIEQLYRSLERHLLTDNFELLIVCRKEDIINKTKWTEYFEKIHKGKIVTVENYIIQGRHNLDKLCQKRNLVIQYAKENKYDYLWFIDSDILINDNTFDVLLEGCEKHKSDICAIPYYIKYLNCCAVGVVENGRYIIQVVNHEENKELEYLEGAGGSGCILIKNTAFFINFKIKSIQISGKSIIGEDIGFNMSAYKKGYKLLYVKNHKIKHL